MALRQGEDGENDIVGTLLTAAQVRTLGQVDKVGLRVRSEPDADLSKCVSRDVLDFVK
jgi:hypothetical protein